MERPPRPRFVEADELSDEAQWIELVRKEFIHAPWVSSLLFAGATMLTIFFPPPIGATTIVLGLASTASACRIYGTLLRREWSAPGPFYVMFAYLPVSIANKMSELGLGEYAALELWTLFAMMAPFVIWRHRGLQIYEQKTTPPHGAATDASDEV